MNYQEALDYLYSFLDSERRLPRTPLDFNLPRTHALLRAFGEPQREFRSIVVAGTKGKGSTCAMIESIARTAGYRTGLWTSPHLHSYRERIQVDRRLIGRGEFAALVERMRTAIDDFDAASYGAPTTFDVGFALALRHFADSSIELAVLEVGLGGRYDSANAIVPLVSVITSISYDHMETLGSTLAEIADQKAGILKPGVPAITVPQQAEAMEAIARVAGEVGAPLWVAAQRTTFDAQPSMFDVIDPCAVGPDPADMALRGDFQRENARLAAGAALLLREAGLAIPDEAIAGGIAAAHWPGRMELVAGDPPIVLDGAHNGDSAEKLVASLRATYPGRRIVMVVGTMRDKDLPRILAALVPAAGALVLARSRHPRALLDLEALARATEPYLEGRGGRPQVVLAGEVAAAMERARELAGPEDVICVTGSLAIVAEAREALGLPNERD